jgi:ABC-type polysaccharide/polyol phosphate export permease
MTRYGTLRTWALVLKITGFFTVVLTIIGAIVWAFEVEGFWQTLGVIFIGAPFAVFVATLGIALGQALTAIADIGDAVRG